MTLLTFLLPLLVLLTPTLALPQAGATTTSLAASPTCTTGPPASQPEDKKFQYAGTDSSTGVITTYTLVRPMDATGAGYSVYGEWYTEHLVSGPHWMGYTHASDPYGPSQCQYLCNAAEEKCAAFFAWYEEVDTEAEHMNCVLFDALITPDMFVFNSNNTIASGGYDRICHA
ncbi:hypothetical protein B0T18DRAFT_425076 [Schizothecium vesticola]|uniref:Apple domain-containing protein n=1 Tax=Schizothecium vesticola TaxID=314040 RepID=A0AA40FBH0_9PEZI|nr:hypothetical protein B0T18DRAFT_425076 [Schizothecium vesticola]